MRNLTKEDIGQTFRVEEVRETAYGDYVLLRNRSTNKAQHIGMNSFIKGLGGIDNLKYNKKSNEITLPTLVEITGIREIENEPVVDINRPIFKVIRPKISMALSHHFC